MNVSVVTINLNRRAGLEKTLASLARQRTKDFELLVIDGGSTDGSLEVCSQYAGIISRLVVEKDKGIFDAWNKGIAASSGKIVGLLNAGDEYHADVISVVNDYVSSAMPDGNRSILCGRAIMVDDGRITATIGNRLPKSVKFGLGVAHPAIFAPRSVYRDVGLYEDISIAADAQFLLRCVRAGIAFKPMEYRVFMEAGGISHSNAQTGFSQYTAALRELGFCGPLQARLIRSAFALYKHRMTFARILAIRPLSASTRHVGVWLMNIGQRVAPGATLRRWFLRLLRLRVDRSARVSRLTTWQRAGSFTIGANSVIEPHVTLNNHEGITIGRGCRIGQSVLITTMDNDIDSPYFEAVTRPTTIGNQVAIGARATVLAGARLEDGVVVLPGSVLGGTTVRNGIYGGVPATLIRTRESEPVY